MLAAIFNAAGAAAAGGRRKPAAENRPGERRASFKKPRGDKDKQRRTHQGGHRPGRQLLRRDQRPGGDIRQHQRQRSHRRSQGSARRMSSVTRRRTTCGTTSPTKPIGPATATAAPQSSAIASRPSSRVWTRLTPRPSATLSPSASTLSRGAMSSATPRPISAGTSAVCSVLQFSPARSPASQCASPAASVHRELISPPSPPTQTLTAPLRTT